MHNKGLLLEALWVIREKFQGYDMGTVCTMEVSFDDTIGHLHEPNKVNSVIILQTLSGDNSEVRNG